MTYRVQVDSLRPLSLSEILSCTIVEFEQLEVLRICGTGRLGNCHCKAMDVCLVMCHAIWPPRRKNKTFGEGETGCIQVSRETSGVSHIFEKFKFKIVLNRVDQRDDINL